MKRSLGWTAGIIACVLGATLAAQKITSIPVTTFISDYDTGIAPALQIQSDKAGAYTNSKTLQSFVYTNGIWELDAFNVKNATRAVYLAFNLPVDGTGPGGGAPIGLPAGNYIAQVTTQCNNYGTNPTKMAPGTAISCPMSLRFDAGGKGYTIHMNPLDGTWAGTDPVRITCIFPSSGSACSQWRITPSATVVNGDSTVTYRSIGQLDLLGSSRGSQTYTNQGQFYFSFVILFSNP